LCTNVLFYGRLSNALFGATPCGLSSSLLAFSKKSILKNTEYHKKTTCTCIKLKLGILDSWVVSLDNSR
jgi:hypothetical protein